MYLKAIRTQGFKSFADKIDLELNKGITCIVGPNGSGKSNIVDAIRWVLGEQSIKSLRGQSQMSDVIFSGSENREVQKRAYVALTFDNSDHALNSEFSEIEVKRVVYATGENEYYLNNSKVRLKDITNLFLDYGAHQNSFNIISQGNITDIVNSKPIDRRVIFESAAGVLKYKNRKEESLKKLDKTENNLKSLRLVIEELETTIKPLEKQSIEAQKYLDIKNELESIDIALIVQDITNLNLEYKVLEKEIDSLKQRLEKQKVNEYDASLERKRLESLELEEKLNEKKDELKKLETKLYEYESEKRITLERQKYEVNKDTINNNLLTLKEEELKLNKNIDLLTKEVSEKENSLKDSNNELTKLQDNLLVLKVKRSNIINNIDQKNKDILYKQNKIDILENNINNDNMTPNAVKNILANPRLKGIHAPIGKLISANDEYIVALNVALGSASNYIVCDNEDNALEAINFLKEKRLGRATFYPLNIIKGRLIENEIIDKIKNIKGFLGIFSNLISYDKIYQNIIDSQLGNVLVVDNAKTMNNLGKLINYKYRIVSLDGEILHAGGSITGGTTKINNLINEKNEINKLKDEIKIIEIELKNLKQELDSYNQEVSTLEEKETTYNKNINLLKEELALKKNNLTNLKNEHKTKIDELEGIDNILNNKLEEKVLELMENISSNQKQQELINKELTKLTSNKNNLNDEIQELERKEKEENNIYKEISNDLKNKEIRFGKIEVNLDNLLISLNNEYNMTYEKAQDLYSLDLEYDLAKSKVNSLKKDLQVLGNVNVGAIKEYERLNTRYEFLNNQKCDLEASSEELKSIIQEMDEIMISKFKDTFFKIKKEFSRIFKLMFKGGKGELNLTNELDLLNTGIEIVAIPPGKKINSPTSLSGGEQALTAIVLLFAILEVNPSPFVVLDETEAALDEVNVDMYGKYLNEEKKRSQFIVITHKKKMMEYADVLYGVTMQEAGVTKIVSAKLEDN